MSRSGYSYDCENLELYRRAVHNAINGRRGQAFLKELLEAMDAMPEKRLIAHELKEGGEVCAIGSVGVRRGLDMSELDPTEPVDVADAFGIACCLAQEIVYINDECGSHNQTPEQRFDRVRRWVVEQLSGPKRENYASDEWHQIALAKWQAKQYD